MIPVTHLIACASGTNDVKGRLSDTLLHGGWGAVRANQIDPIMDQYPYVSKVMLLNPFGVWNGQITFDQYLWCRSRNPHLMWDIEQYANAMQGIVHDVYIGCWRNRGEDVPYSLAPLVRTCPEIVYQDAMVLHPESMVILQPYGHCFTSGVEALPDKDSIFDSYCIPWIATGLAFRNYSLANANLLQHPGAIMWRGEGTGDGTVAECIAWCEAKPNRRLVLNMADISAPNRTLLEGAAG